jgi:hypothetical protein
MSKRFTVALVVSALVVAALAGCAGETRELQMKDSGGGQSKIVFPKGTIFGGASTEQASDIAKIFVDSHNMIVTELADAKVSARRTEETTKRTEETVKRIEETANKNRETAQKALDILVELSRRQGSGEITIFFPVGEGVLANKSVEYERLVRFLDYVSRESRGRKVLLLSIGSASAFGDKKLNEKLARKRSEAPVDIANQLLVNIPHEFYKVYDTGDAYSPKGVTMKEHRRYQQTRLISVFETDRLPALPQEPSKEPKN